MSTHSMISDCMDRFVSTSSSVMVYGKDLLLMQEHHCILEGQNTNVKFDLILNDAHSLSLMEDQDDQRDLNVISMTGCWKCGE